MSIYCLKRLIFWFLFLNSMITILKMFRNMSIYCLKRLIFYIPFLNSMIIRIYCLKRLIFFIYILNCVKTFYWSYRISRLIKFILNIAIWIKNFWSTYWSWRLNSFWLLWMITFSKRTSYAKFTTILERVNFHYLKKI